MTSASLSRNLAVFEIAKGNSLLHRLRDLYPGEQFRQVNEFELNDSADGDPIQIWNWEGSVDEFLTRSSGFLRSHLFPILSRETRFVLGFPFSIDELSPRPWKINERDQLDPEDIGSLLKANAVLVGYEQLGSFSERLPQTPIELMLAEAMTNQGLEFEPQVRLGRYQVDFLVKQQGQQLVVEADGRGFHDPDYDAIRDEFLKGSGITDVIRFTGSEIFRDANRCARDVKDSLTKSIASSKNRDIDSQLDDSQRPAVQARSRATRVLAPAGSGKTRVLLNRVVHLVNNGVDPSGILVLAFNRRAAEQLNDGLVHEGIPVSKMIFGSLNSGVTCRTFNSFGLAYQREIAGLTLETQPDSRFWARQMEQALLSSGINLGQLPISRGTSPLDQFLAAQARVRAGLTAPSDVEVELELFADEKNRIVPFAPVYHAFTKQQLDHNLQTFDDHVYISVADMLKVPSNRMKIQQQFEYVLVDEYQDLNDAQHALVDIVSRPHRNLFVVGDDDQLIYGWRFAKSSGILGFHDRMPDHPISQTFALSTNYRSSKKIIADSSRLISHNKRREPKQIQPGPSAEPGSVRYVRSDNTDHRLSAINSFVAELNKPASNNWKDFAILCRYKAQWPVVAMSLDSAGIPRTALLPYRLFTHPAARLFRAYLGLVADPARLDVAGIAYLVNRPNRYVSKVDMESLRSAEKPLEFLAQLGENNRSVQELCDVSISVAQSIGARSASARVLIRTLINEFDLERYWKDETSPRADQEKDDASAMDVMRVIELMIEDHPTIQDFVKNWDRLHEEELERLNSPEEKENRERKIDGDEVLIGTIHSAKGREFKGVVIFDYNPDLDGLSVSELEEERRVLYVAATRAISDLMVTIDARQSIHPYIKEMLAPAEAGERQAIAQQLHDLDNNQKDAVIAISNTKESIRRLNSGEELEELEEVVAVTPALIKTVRLQLEEIRQKTSWEGRARIVSIITGEQSRLSKRKTEFEERLRELETQLSEASDRLAIIQEDPVLAVRQFEQAIEEANLQLAQIEQSRADRNSRIIELEILSAKSDDPSSSDTSELPW